MMESKIRRIMKNDCFVFDLLPQKSSLQINNLKKVAQSTSVLINKNVYLPVSLRGVYVECSLVCLKRRYNLGHPLSKRL